jgi:hypothetical protein
VQLVVAAQPEEGVRSGVPEEHVRTLAADHVLDTHEGVPLTGLALDGASHGEVHGHSVDAIVVPRRILGAGTAVEQIRPGAAVEVVEVAVIGEELVGVGAALQHVVLRPTMQRVLPGTAEELVVSRSAVEDVVPIAADQLVNGESGDAGERVVALATVGDHLDALAGADACVVGDDVRATCGGHRHPQEFPLGVLERGALHLGRVPDDGGAAG